MSALFGRCFKVKGQCTCEAREARVGRQREARDARVFCAREFYTLNSVCSEKFYFIRQDVVLAALQFCFLIFMSSGSGEKLKEVEEQMAVLVKQEIPSILMYQRIALDLAAGSLNAGRVLVIQFFSEAVKEHLVKKICGISQSEYRNQSWFRWLTTYFSRQAVNYRRLVREIEHINGLCLIFAHLRLQCGSTGDEKKENQ